MDTVSIAPLVGPFSRLVVEKLFRILCDVVDFGVNPLYFWKWCRKCCFALSTAGLHGDIGCQSCSSIVAVSRHFVGWTQSDPRCSWIRLGFSFLNSGWSDLLAAGMLFYFMNNSIASAVNVYMDAWKQFIYPNQASEVLMHAAEYIWLFIWMRKRHYCYTHCWHISKDIVHILYLQRKLLTQHSTRSELAGHDSVSVSAILRSSSRRVRKFDTVDSQHWSALAVRTRNAYAHPALQRQRGGPVVPETAAQTY